MLGITRRHYVLCHGCGESLHASKSMSVAKGKFWHVGCWLAHMAQEVAQQRTVLDREHVAVLGEE